MRRVYLRGQANVLKRVLIHLGGFNLSLIMRRRFGKGTPRGWQGFSADALLMGLQFWIAILARCTGKHIAANAPIFTCRARHHCCPVRGAVTKLLPPRAARGWKLFAVHSSLGFGLLLLRNPVDLFTN